MEDEVKIMTIYAAYPTQNEYGKLGKVQGYYREETDAQDATIGIGWYGGMGMTVKKKAMEVDGKLFILESAEPVTLQK